MSKRRNGRTPSKILAAVVATGLLTVLPALAPWPMLVMLILGTLGRASQLQWNPYPLSGPRDVEVDQSSHDIYVADSGNHRIEKFNAAGQFLFMFGREVNKTAAENARTSDIDVCPAPGHPADVCQAGISGSSAGAFVTPAYLAVDNSGGPSRETSMSATKAIAVYLSSTRPAASLRPGAPAAKRTVPIQI